MPTSEEIFLGIDRMHELIRCFGNIDAFVEPQIHPVESYAVRKTDKLISRKVECRIQDPRARRRHNRVTARGIVFSKSFGECRIEVYARKCLFLKTYQRARAIRPDLPRIADGIGICFLGSIGKFNNILERLLEFSRPERNQLMEGIRLKGAFIDRFIGQFIYSQFEVHAPKLPRPPYGTIWWHR